MIAAQRNQVTALLEPGEKIDQSAFGTAQDGSAVVSDHAKRTSFIGAAASFGQPEGASRH
jgi:hypothetical protein